MHRVTVQRSNDRRREHTNAYSTTADHRHYQEDDGQQQPQDFAEAALRREVRALHGEVGSFTKQPE